jgi:hypothetical protein
MRGLGERFMAREWALGGQLGIGCGRIVWTYVVSMYPTIHPKKIGISIFVPSGP